MEPFLGEIRYFPFNFVPEGWAACIGTQMALQQNVALYSLLGIQYGGNGSTNFNLPDLRGRIPVGMGVRASDGASFVEGKQFGSETVSLSSSQVAIHNHQLYASGNTPAANSDNKNPAGNLTGHAATGSFPPPNSGGIGMTGLYNSATTATTAVSMHASTVATAGASTGHQNCAPSLTLMPCIAITGLFPPRQ